MHPLELRTGRDSYVRYRTKLALGTGSDLEIGRRARVTMVSIVVLVVDDEPLIRLSIVADLEGEGFAVFEAACAEEAIAVIERHPEIRLVFTDVDMPGSMDGLKLAEFVRDRWPPIKIIVTSGHHNVEPNDLPDGSPFMAKPYISANVAAIIRELLSN